jgi:hypothetical protein
MLRIVTVYPDLLGTYGDRGNGLVLWRRALARGIEAQLVAVASDAPLPDADLYCVGGGEDGPQQLATERLAGDGGLARNVESGAVVLAVCAGFQILGRSFPGPEGQRLEGLGLFAIDTVRGSGARAVGEVVVQTDGLAGAVTGFENHAGHTVRDEGVAALGRVALGTGNGDGTDGALQGRLVGTYLHGPVLARNPMLADWLLATATGSASLAAIADDPSVLLHDERLSSAAKAR